MSPLPITLLSPIQPHLAFLRLSCLWVVRVFLTTPSPASAPSRYRAETCTKSANQLMGPFVRRQLKYYEKPKQVKAHVSQRSAVCS